MALPIDFEKLVKLPAGNGYPYSLKSEDLMKNFAYCDLLPSAEADDVRIELDEVPGKTARHKQRRLRVVGGAGGAIHPFKVTAGSSSGAYNIRAGAVDSDLVSVAVSAQTDYAAADGDMICLKIARNATSRALETAVYYNNVLVAPPSTDTFQYIAIAEISGTTIIQHRFEDIRLCELLIQDAGELKFVTVFDTTNTYALP